MLEIKDLYVNYGQRVVLRGVSMKVQQGELVALIGPNGAGKTTLIRAASGVLPLKSGDVQVMGESLRRLPSMQRARRVSVVPQARELPNGFTVFDTVLLGRTPYLNFLGQPGLRDTQRVEWALERTGIRSLAGRLIGELSGGEQQLVMLARALAQQTSILLLDEPTTHLDLGHQAQLLNLAKELASEAQLAVLMAIHDLNMAALYANRVALLIDGSLQAVGTPDEVLTLENLETAYQTPLIITRHPEHGTPLILPDGGG